MSGILDLVESKASPETLAAAAMEDRELLEEMMQSLAPDNRNEDTRYASHQALVRLSEQHPKLLYDRWDYLAGLLRSERGHAKYNAVYILANLTRVDTERRFDQAFRAYFDLLDDPSVVVAAHTAANAGKIARFRPDLQSGITAELLSIGSGTRLRPERADLVRGYAIQALGEFFEAAPHGDREAILGFIHRQTQSASPKTKKLAKEFLRRFQA